MMWMSTINRMGLLDINGWHRSSDMSLSIFLTTSYHKLSYAYAVWFEYKYTQIPLHDSSCKGDDMPWALNCSVETWSITGPVWIWQTGWPLLSVYSMLYCDWQWTAGSVKTIDICLEIPSPWINCLEQVYLRSSKVYKPLEKVCISICIYTNTTFFTSIPHVLYHV